MAEQDKPMNAATRSEILQRANADLGINRGNSTQQNRGVQGPSFDSDAFFDKLVIQPSHRVYDNLESAKTIGARVKQTSNLGLPADFVLSGDPGLDAILKKEARDKKLDANPKVARGFAKNAISASLLQHDIDQLINVQDNAISRANAVNINIDGNHKTFFDPPEASDFPVKKYGFVEANRLLKDATKQYELGQQNINAKRATGKLAPGEERTFTEGVYEPFLTGARGGVVLLDVLAGELNLGGSLYDAQRESIDNFNAGREPEEQIFFDQDIPRTIRREQLKRRTESLPIPGDIRKGMERIQNSDGFLNTAIQIVKDLPAFVEIVQTSYAQSVVFTGGIGTVAYLLGPVGFAARFAGSGIMEYAAGIEDMGSRYGYDLTKAEQMYALLNNEEHMSEARKFAVKRGLSIAGFDALTFGLAKQFLKVRIPQDQAALAAGEGFSRVTKTVAGTAGIEMLGAGTGEVGAQVITDQPLNWADILTETFSQLSGLTGSITAMNTAQNIDRQVTEVKQRDAATAASQAQAHNEVADALSNAESMNLDAPAGRAAVQSALEETIDPDATVSISTDVYNQAVNDAREAGIEINQSDDVTEQLKTAEETTLDVVISKSEFYANFINTPGWDNLVSNVRESPLAMNLQEAQAFFQGENTEVADAVDRAVSKIEKNQSDSQVSNIIYKQMLKSMGSLQRLSSSQAAASAQLATRIYMRSAESLGISALDYYNARKPKFAESVPGGNTFNQEIGRDVDWLSGSQAVNGLGQPTPMRSITDETGVTRYEPASENDPEAMQSEPTYALSVKNAFVVPQQSLNDVDLMAQHLINQGVLVADDVTRLSDTAESNEQLLDLLKQEIQNAGFDSVTYSTDEGAQGYATFNEAQTKPLQNVEELNQNEDLGDVFEQRGKQQELGREVPQKVSAVSNVEANFKFAATKSFDTNREFKLAIQKRVKDAAKKAGVDLEDFTVGVEQYLVQSTLVDAITALRTNPNAVGWYNEKVTKALNLLSLVHPELATDPEAKFAFTWALAATSNGLKVNDNFKYAEAAYAYFKENGVMPTNIQAGTAQKAINGAMDMYNELIARDGFEAVEQFMTTMHTVKEVEAYTKTNVSGENKTTMVYGAAAMGPKIGNGFFANLYGHFEQLTMDRWLMRTWGRWTGTLVEENKTNIKTKSTQLKDLIRLLSKEDKKAFESILKIKMTLSNVEAVAVEIKKRSMKPANRELMNVIGVSEEAVQKLEVLFGKARGSESRVGFGDQMRKVGNSLAGYLDGQKEAPSGPPERNRIRRVFQQALTLLQQDNPALTMSDLQALLWYPEKRLYDAAKTKDKNADAGYEDDAAPDYANAAAALAKSKGVSDDIISATIREVDNGIRTNTDGAGASQRGVGKLLEEFQKGRSGRSGRSSAGRLNQQSQQGARGAFDPTTLTVTLLNNADASTMIHEMGHLFFENNVDVANQLLARGDITEAQQRVLNDTNVLFNHLGIEGPIDQQLGIFASLPFEEKRFYHEKFAESWERYAFEGKSPSIELNYVFQKFKDFMKSVYQTIKAFIDQNPEAGDLSAEVRAVFDRMLATDQEIELAIEARSMMPLFESASAAGISEDAYEQYLAINQDARFDALEKLDKRSLADLKWYGNARAKQIRKLQHGAQKRRRELRSRARIDVLGEPIYQAWQFLTNKIGESDKIKDFIDPVESKKGPVDSEIDSLFVAIAKLGGLSQKAVEQEWGVDPKDKPAPFGRSPVIRVKNGLSIDAMTELLAEHGYLELDENGKADVTDLEDKFLNSLVSGEDVYSNNINYNIINLQARPGDQVAYPDALAAGRFDYGDLVAEVGEDSANKLKALGMTAGQGLNAKMIAERFGFASDQELVNKLLNSDDIKTALDAMVDRRMIERYADLSDKESIEGAVEKALASELRARAISTELNILGRALGKTKVTSQAAKMQAEAVLKRMKIRSIKPRDALNAANRAAKAARNMLKKGNTQQAYIEKMNELLAQHLSKQGYAARELIDKKLSYFASFSKASARTRLDPEYVDTILDVLSRFDLTDTSIASADRKSSFSKYLLDQLAEGKLPEVSFELFLTPEQRAQFEGELLRNPDMEDAQKTSMLAGYVIDGQKKSHFDLTYDEFIELGNTVESIEQQGKLKNTLLAARDQRTVVETRNALVTKINETGAFHRAAGRKAPDNKTPVNFRGRAKKMAKRYGASMVRTATLAYIMDGGVDTGPVWNFLIRAATSRQAWETENKAQATETFEKICAPLFKAGKKLGGMQKVKFWQSVNQSFTFEEVVTMALNFGNESNVSRLTLNNTLSEPELRALFKEALTADHWKMIQNIWNYLDSWRPKIGAQMKRIEGREPDWVVPMPFEITTSDGQKMVLDGGYYPVIYDPEASVRASDQDAIEQAKQQMATGRSVQTTRRSFTKSRYDGEIEGRPLLLNLNGLFTGVGDVIHDLAWREWLIDFNKIMGKGPVSDAIFQNFGREAYEVIVRWREDIARGSVAENGIGWMFGALRKNVSVTALGFNITNSVLQITGLFGALTRVKGKYLMPELVKFVANPKRRTAEVKELSSFMRTRSKTRFRELREVMNVVEGESSAYRTFSAGMYFLMLQVQQITDVITWNGAYQQQMEVSGDHEVSADLADQIVKDTQGSGEIMDVSQIERGNTAQKFFTVFYNFAGTQLNMLLATKNMTKASKMRKLWLVLLVAVMPVIAEQIIKNSSTPGELEEYDPDNPTKFARQLAGEFAGYWLNMFVFLRELGYPVKASIQGNYYGGYRGPSGTRIFSDASEMVNQAAQGEVDEAFVRAGINLMGSTTAIPSAQINRSIKGTKAYIEGDTDNPTSVIFGYQGD